MTEKETIQALYNKYLSNEISFEELENLLGSLDKGENEALISSLMDKTWDEMFDITPAKVVPLKKRTWFRVAAVFTGLVLLSVSGYFIFTKPGSNTVAKVNTVEKPPLQVIPHGGNRAVLTLSDGTQIILDSVPNGSLASQGAARIIKKENGELLYAAGTQKATEMVYNTISTPKGGKYSIVLQDGTKVWLNAESVLKFPVSFSGKTREVSLKGEGYFEVAKNASMPFRVSTDGAVIEVLGTHFNINAYVDESAIATTVLEGSVKVTRKGMESTGNGYALLKAGEQAGLEKSGKFKIDTHADVEEAVAWKNDMFQFNNADLSSMMRQFSRWYNVKIEFRGTVPVRKFSGKFSRNMNLDQLVEMLRFAGINMKTDKNNIIVMEEIPAS